MENLNKPQPSDKRASPLTWMVLIFTFAALILYWLRDCNVETKPFGGLIKDKVEQYKDKLNEERAKIETSSNGNNTAFLQSEIDRLTKALGVKQKDILAVTNVNAVLRDSVKLVTVTLDAEKNKVWNWEKKYESGSAITATMSEKDSVLVLSADIKLQSTDYVDRGGLFGKDRYYTDFYSPDQNIKINGAKTFRKETIIKPKRVGIGVQFGYGLSTDFKIAPYVGIGLSYNLISF